MTSLSVNINKVATLRNSRGGNVPDLLKVAEDLQAFGAQGITIHPRPDQRHIRYEDARNLPKVVKTEFNIEGNPTTKFLSLVCEVKPTQVTLVPDAVDAITSSAGWDIKKHGKFLKGVIDKLKNEGIRTSIFIDPDISVVDAALETGTDRIELYTEKYAKAYYLDRENAITPYILAAEKANELGIGVNAGHDLNMKNLAYFAQNIPNLLEVSIGHALISESLYLGFKNVISKYLECLVN
ncbi:pyridoxine 5'-phosphate synthase [Flavobacteriaceae bacterium]|nr:pyridoxine 5'-phosphate synthase [Flavobacteriaceae bacterium]